jgi:hypothetical protein
LHQVPSFPCHLHRNSIQRMPAYRAQTYSKNNLAAWEKVIVFVPSKLGFLNLEFISWNYKSNKNRLLIMHV